MKEKIIKDIQDNIRVKQALLETHVPLIEKAARMAFECIQSGGKLIFFGNG